jgi:hypothetical protein
MARIRTVKPEFFTSDDICALSPFARLLYVGLWCEADREGRLVWTPGVLKRRYLPDDPCDIADITAELIGRGLVVLYGEGLAYIPTFSRHQHVNAREALSKLPPPAGEAARDLRTGREGEGKEGNGKEGSGKEGEGTRVADPLPGRAHAIPADWKPDEEDLAWVASARPDLDRAAIDAETERFRLHASAHSRLAHRWGPNWRLWVSKAHVPPATSAGRSAGIDLGVVVRDGEDQWRARLRRYRPGKFWMEGDWGPRPESGSSRVPPALLAEWRQQQGAS